MVKRQAAPKQPSSASGTTNELVEQRLLEFAEQLGSLVGTVQAKAEGWLDTDALRKELARIRDSATELLGQVERPAKAPRTAATKAAEPVAPAERATARGLSRRLVAAPGKRHRQPPPQERGDKRMTEPKGIPMGQKSAKIGRRGGRQ